MKNNIFETLVGAFVLLVAICFLAFSLKNSSISSSDGYLISAQFDNIDGVGTGSDVKISGTKIGYVHEEKLNKENYRAIVYMMIDEDVKLPIDSSIKISSSGLLGAKYLDITPGSEDEILKTGEEIEFTQSSVNFEELLGKFIFGSQQENNGH